MAQLIVRFVYYLLEALTWAIVIRSLLSWIPNLSPNNPLVRVLNQITEPLLAPARRIIRPVGGLDLAPLVVFFLLFIVTQLLAPYVR